MKRGAQPRAAVEGLPSDRPRCPWCGQMLRPIVRDVLRDEGQGRYLARVFVRWRAYDGLFDRVVCGLRFGAAAHSAGYRVKGE